ncbi:MAG TPA: HAD-IA family hydrolase, partial [Candidatus Saccharimonadia bacterium]|nr:HAD-IA family hydrolase [Candidatus Saccharimonadia bacterium]
VLALVDQLRELSLRVGLLSNLATPTPWSKELYHSGTADHFDVMLLSGETGFVKPEPEAFLMLADRLEVAPEELVFIDDTPEALSGVEKLGIRPIVYQGLSSLRSSLADLGILLPTST